MKKLKCIWHDGSARYYTRDEIRTFQNKFHGAFFNDGERWLKIELNWPWNIVSTLLIKMGWTRVYQWLYKIKI